MLMLKLGDVRWASLIPRDSRSFSQEDQPLAETTIVAAQNLLLHGPESTTFTTSNKPIDGELPPLENVRFLQSTPIRSFLTVPLSQLIAKYGDATNTSWIDPAWTVWRDTKTGGAVGYVPQNGFTVTFGNHLCEPKQIPAVVRAYLHFLSHDKKLKPVRRCVDAETEKVLHQGRGGRRGEDPRRERLSPTSAIWIDQIRTTTASPSSLTHNIRSVLILRPYSGPFENSIGASYSFSTPFH